jgi:hypothetical protein
MLKNILKLEGAQKLTKNEQKSINGGYIEPDDPECNSFYIVSANEATCLSKPYNLRPVYLGNNRCSLLAAPC